MVFIPGSTFITFPEFKATKLSALEYHATPVFSLVAILGLIETSFFILSDLGIKNPCSF